MKKLKKLSLENEMKKEAEQIEKKVREDRSLDDITVSDEMEKELFNKIQDYEYDKRHKKVVRKKKKSKLVIGALAAVLILVCGSVMTSVGSKSYWKMLWNDSNGDEQNNGIDVENMESIESEDIDESAVYKEIAKVMGNYLVRMEYKPEDMMLKKYSVDSEQRRVTLFYQYGQHPQLILIGGGVSAQQELLIDPLAAQVCKSVMPAFVEGLEIKAAALQNDAGLVGAVYYFRENQ